MPMPLDINLKIEIVNTESHRTTAPTWRQAGARHYCLSREPYALPSSLGSYSLSRLRESDAHTQTNACRRRVVLSAPAVPNAPNADKH